MDQYPGEGRTYASGVEQQHSTGETSVGGSGYNVRIKAHETRRELIPGRLSV